MNRKHNPRHAKDNRRETLRDTILIILVAAVAFWVGWVVSIPENATEASATVQVIPTTQETYQVAQPDHTVVVDDTTPVSPKGATPSSLALLVAAIAICSLCAVKARSYNTPKENS